MPFIGNTCVRSGQIAGRRLAFMAFSTISGLMLSQSALASNITVGNPVNGARVASTVWVRAHNVGCSGLRPNTFGFSIDNSKTITWGVSAYDIDADKVPVTAGTHTIHFKSWTTHGICQVVSTTFTAAGAGTSTGGNNGNGSGSGSGTGSGNGSGGGTVGGGSGTGTGSGSGSNGSGTGSGSTGSQGNNGIPSNAVSSDILDGKDWLFERDPAISGESSGSTVFPATTPLYDDAREFYMTYSSRGGQRWHLSFAKDPAATHFVYDTYVYFVDPTQVANLELDMNQVMSDGRTVIFGTQCSVYSKTWEYTLMAAATHWHPSNIPCNPQTWTANTWHHIQIASHRDDAGIVTYDWVNVDGTHSEFNNATGKSAEHLGWQKGTLLINFQIDGASKSSGTITAYAHQVTVFRW